MEDKEIDIKQYLNKIGFDEEDIETVLTYASNEIDQKSLHEKIKYLISLNLSASQIRIILEEDLTFVTEELSLIKSNVEVLKQYLNSEEIINTLEVSPEVLTLKNGDLEQNIKLIKLIIPEEESFKIVLQDRGELLTYKPDYLSDKLSFFIKNGLKEELLRIIIEDVEIFELDNDEINIEELK